VINKSSTRMINARVQHMQNEDVSPMKPPQSARHELLELNEGSALKSEIKLLKTKQTPSHSPSNNIETPRSDQE
jgi:hypothetical protein